MGEEQLNAATVQELEKVLLLHCYPSDLKEGGEELAAFVLKHRIKLDMGYTHYNELSHDGHTLYTANRSTGQIEEGEAGFSVTNLDHGVNWRFLDRRTACRDDHFAHG